MPKRKNKGYVTLSRNSYKGRLMGVLPAFLPNRCEDLSGEERLLIMAIEESIRNLIATMNKRK